MNILRKPKRIKYKIGDKIGNWTVLNYNFERRLMRYVCECKCGRQSTKILSNFKENCPTCAQDKRRGFKTFSFSPGLILDGLVLINRIKGPIWKVKCVCGKICELYLRKYEGKYFVHR